MSAENFKMSSDLATGRPLVTFRPAFSLVTRDMSNSSKELRGCKEDKSRKVWGDGEREEKEVVEGRQRHVYLSCFLR